MKYADMQREIAADKYAKATGKKAPDAPIREPVPKPDRSDRVQFRMWKAEHQAAGQPQYFATMRVPRDVKKGDLLLVEAYVVEDEPLEGKAPRRGFEGRVYNVERMVQKAEVVGDRNALPADLLTVLDQKPFDDPLP